MDENPKERLDEDFDDTMSDTSASHLTSPPAHTINHKLTSSKHYCIKRGHKKKIVSCLIVTLVFPIISSLMNAL